MTGFGKKRRSFMLLACLCLLPLALSDSKPAASGGTAVHADAPWIRLPVWVVSDPLPAHASVAEFTGQRDGADVQLTWTTEREIGNSGFHVQRASSESRGWEELTFVTGFGNSQLTQTYHFRDRKAPPEDLRYTLRIIGNDGILRSFPVEGPQDRAGKLFRVRVGLTATATVAMQVSDHRGITLLRVMGGQELESGTHDIELDCSRLLAGRYTLLLHTPEGRYRRQVDVK